jgi:hypothetical protein
MENNTWRIRYNVSVNVLLRGHYDGWGVLKEWKIMQ